MIYFLSFNYSGKSPSIWDHFFHEKEEKLSDTQVANAIPNKNSAFFHKQVNLLSADFASTGDSVINGDIACDSYHLLEEDIKNLVALKV